jgi:hypothetical protein
MSADPMLGAALVACVREHDDGAPPELLRVLEAGQLGSLLQLARHHRVLPFVHRELREVDGVDVRTMQALDRHAVTQTANQMRIVTDLAGFAAMLAPIEVQWITFKGPVLAQRCYERPELRTYRDLDLLIARDDFPEVVTYLQGGGVDVIDRNWTLIRRERRGQLHLTLPMGTVADLHWHLLNRAVVRDSFDVDMGSVLTRTRTVVVSGVDVETLSAVDTVVHLALHAALAGGDRLIWMKDLERSIAAETLDWDEVVARAFAWRAGAAVASTLQRARDVLGAQVPVWVLRDLEPSGARRRIGAAFDRRWPTERADGEVTPAALWPQVVRDGRFATAGSIARRAARRPANVFRELFGEPGGGGRDHEPAAVLHPSGGEGVRADYLRDVTDEP